MKGLLRKALAFHKHGNRRGLAQQEEAPPESPEEQDESTGISAEEKRQITDQIDRLMAENRIEVSPQNLSYVPRRNGALLPLFSNVSIISVAIIAILVISHFLNRQEQSLATGGSAILTMESKLIAALKQETDQELRERDRAILETRNRLDALSKEKDQLRAETDSLVRSREQELQGEFDRRLAAERDRLEKQGGSSAAVEQKLKNFSDAEKRQLEQQIARNRQEAEAQLATKQQAMVSLEAQYQRDLEEARQERIRLQGEASQKQEELEKQNEQQARQAEGEAARVGEELARLRAQQDQEKLITDQVAAGYGRVNEFLQALQYDQALLALASLRKLLDDSSVSSLPALQRRRGVELFLIGSLEELVKERQGKGSSQTTSLAQGSSLIGEVSDMVRRGDELTAAGDQRGARLAYEAAMGKIPEVAAGFGKLEILRTAAEKKSADDVSSLLRQGNVFYQAGNFQASIDRYQQSLALLLNDKALSRQVTDSLTRAGYRIFAAEELSQLARLKTAELKRQDLNARLRDIRAQYKAYVALVPKSAATDPSSAESLATLLQAKILLRQVLDTEPVRSQYPDLAAKTERYLDAVSARAKEDGRKEALEGLGSLLDKLQTNDKTPPANMSRVSVQAEPDPLLRLLDRLQVILQ